MAFLSRDLIEAMQKDSGITIKSLKVDGGASANEYLCAFQSSLLNMRVIRQSFKEATALGAARLAGLAVGFYKMQDFKEMDYDVFEPLKHDASQALYKLYLEALEKLLK